MGLNGIGVLLLLALAGLAWWHNLGARTTARRAARKACAEAGVGFIDEIALKRLRPARAPGGGLCLRRTYGFEFFVAGDRRYAGEVEMRARRIARVHLDPYPFPAPDPE